MAVREALLTLLCVEPTYGFRLHTELVRRLPQRANLNVGQTYSTLDRLSKAGLIEGAGSTPDGLPLFRVTPTGRDAVRVWLRGANGSGSALDESTERVLLALSLGPALPVDLGDVATLLERERSGWARAVPAPPSANATETVLAELGYRQARALTDWLTQLAASNLARFVVPLSEPAAKRGRPKKSPAAS